MLCSTKTPPDETVLWPLSVEIWFPLMPNSESVHTPPPTAIGIEVELVMESLLLMPITET